MALYIGIDVGGTAVKGVVTDKSGKIYSEGNSPTSGDLSECVEALIDSLVLKAGAVFSDIAAIGVGCPRTISENGEVILATNLGLENYPLKKLLEEKFKKPVKVSNDANAAALGEAVFGAGKGFSDSILITLGTGVGGGIILGGKLFEGNKGAGAEIGHMVIERGGLKCSCGRHGCFEAYCSARALTKMTKDAMEDDTSSEMWKSYTHETADGRTAFEYSSSDRSAKKVVDRYLHSLACGITNLCNIFRPQVVMLGGGVAAQGSRLTAPLQKLVDSELFGGTEYAPVDITCATLGTRAGALGAAALNMNFDGKRR